MRLLNLVDQLESAIKRQFHRSKRLNEGQPANLGGPVRLNKRLDTVQWKFGQTRRSASTWPSSVKRVRWSPNYRVPFCLRASRGHRALRCAVWTAITCYSVSSTATNTAIRFVSFDLRIPIGGVQLAGQSRQRGVYLHWRQTMKSSNASTTITWSSTLSSCQSPFPLNWFINIASPVLFVHLGCFFIGVAALYVTIETDKTLEEIISTNDFFYN